MIGFTEQVSLKELAELGRPYGIPVMEDLGSGCLIDFASHGLIEEPTVQDSLAQGADLVTFSGDKLLGGPQAGIILGRRDLVQAISKNQLTRALRIDKLTLLALEETLRLYRDQASSLREIPTLRMIFEPYAELVKKARRLRRMAGQLPTENFMLELADGDSRAGGGALPYLKLPSRLLCLVPGKLSARCMESRLRASDPPVIGRLEKDRVLLDVRTIRARELKTVARAIRTLAEIDEP
jgi:L-seryl-tRNA(Ser) seleniumtransferase